MRAMTASPPAPKKITVTVKTAIGQSWDDDQCTTDDPVAKLVDDAVKHFEIKLDAGITAQAVFQNQTLDRQKTLGAAGVKDKDILFLEVGPPMSNEVVISICCYLIGVAAVALLILFAIWPKTVVNNPGNVTSYAYDHLFFWYVWNPNPELVLLLVVMCSGVLGAFVQSMASLVQHKTNSDLGARWKDWYYSRIPLAIGLALLVYILVRAGLISMSNVTLGNDPTHISVFAVAAVSAIVGMFTDEATKRLGKVVDALFGVEEQKGTS